MSSIEHKLDAGFSLFWWCMVDVKKRVVQDVWFQVSWPECSMKVKGYKALSTIVKMVTADLSVSVSVKRVLA